ncbi:Pr6Pr family membrane protein [Salipiger sp. P9]|uniref:Pr6Pr family membrane protein n=1 Tax=Salipiger pentaromativorans TaxID=2943193 RepID=UPI002157BA2B|nr:Pr6Pr family membrane protein [Salipiger pentaromativorans]MCR8547864.1 Pr6Pr family membrane protein [Salipiger pentaromativorans]
MTKEQRLFAVLIAGLTLAALVVQFMATAGNNPDYTPPETLWRLARYFTILTNALVAGTFLWMALGNRMAAAAWLGGLALWIGIVGVVYHLLLAKPLTGLDALADLGLHTVTPVLTVLFWVFAAPKHGLRFKTALVWMLWPLAYVGYALLRGQIEGIYPYFFVDPTQIGWAGVLRWSGILCVGFVSAGGVQVGIARLLR